MPRASILVRLSKQSREENLSRDGMENDCRALAARLGCEVVHVRIDDGISGAVRDRPGYQAWLADGRSGAVDTLLTWSVDRASREGANALAALLDVAEGKDETGAVVRPPVRVVDTKGIDSNDEDTWRLRLLIAGEVARSERRAMSERNQAARSRLRKAGRWPGGKIPFGCKVVKRRDPESGKVGKYLEPDESGPAPLLREAAERLVSGDTMRSLAHWLTQESGRQWHRTGVRAVLLSKPTATYILSPALRRAVVERLASPDRQAKPGRPTVRLLRGLLVCSSCGRTMTTNPRTNGATRYACAKGSATAGRCERIITIRADAADDYVEQEFLRIYGDTSWFYERTELVGAADLDEAERLVERLREEVDRDDSTEETFREFKAAQRALAAARATPQRYERKISLSDHTFAEQWERSQIPERAEMLASALARPIVVGPGSVGGANPATDAAARLDITWQRDVADDLEPPSMLWVDPSGQRPPIVEY
jgi:site-specific DNA recombinase